MYRIIPYLKLCAAAMLLQILLFDNLAIGSCFNPLVYIVIIVLLPVETLPVVMLLAGGATGMAADLFTAGAGLNAAATMAAAFIRQPLLSLFRDRDEMRGGVPSAQLFGNEGRFIRYAAALVFIHHGIFFLLESLSAAGIGYALLRLLLSGSFTLLFVLLAARLFNLNVSSK